MHEYAYTVYIVYDVYDVYDVYVHTPALHCMCMIYVHYVFI